jgi:hypothetical protein
MIAIAQLGGFLNRPCDGPPGFECLWKGYSCFDAMVRIMHLRQSSAAKPRRPMRRRKSVGHAQG